MIIHDLLGLVIVLVDDYDGGGNSGEISLLCLANSSSLIF